MPKTQFFAYVQDEWKIKPNFTATLGLRYEFFNELSERYGRTLGFNIAERSRPLPRRRGTAVTANTEKRTAMPIGRTWRLA